MKSGQPNDTTDDSVLSVIPLWSALVPVLVLIVLLVCNVDIFGDGATYGANQIALLMAAATAVGLGKWLGTPLGESVDAITASIASSLKAILILLIIGGLIGTWMISGIVPAMVFYGLQILSPSAFLIMAVLISSIVALATGSSWTTAGTVGVALLEIGRAMGFDPSIVAGAIISGAYFGDKISPLSDTTNLAPAMAGTDLYTHIRYMLWTTIPSYTITLLLMGWLNYQNAPAASEVASTAISQIIDREFNISPWLFVVPGIVIVMVARRIDPVVSLFVAMLLGAVVAICFQPSIVNRLGSATGDNATVIVSADEWNQAEPKPEGSFRDSYPVRAYTAAIKSMALTTSFSTGDSHADDLLGGKGMEGMLNTIWLILCAMCFGGAMEASGFLQRITQPLVNVARSTGALIATTAASCIFVNITASDQYIAIVVPGRMFRKTYAERGLAPQNLSRTLEDSGTVTSVLVPWNTCGAAMFGFLGVATISYAPYAVFCWISPVITVLVAMFGIGIARLEPADSKLG